MTPALQTLDPAVGIARSFAILPPERGGELWKVLVDIGLGAVDDYPLASVGAYDLTRRGAVERAAGEAVERFALAAHADAVAYGTPERARVDARIEVRTPRAVDGLPLDSAWYRATVLSDATEVLVPAEAIDDDGGRRHEALGGTDPFDPSPSGTAAGLSLERATRAALREIIERDAVLCAWATRIGVRHTAPASGDGDLRRLCDGAERRGLRPWLGLIPTSVPGAQVVCCAIIDRTVDGPLVSFGSKAAASVVSATKGALQEALQIHELLGNLRRRLERPRAFDVPSPALVTDDVARAWWWTTPEAAESMVEWISTWGTAEPDDRGPEAEGTTSMDLVRGIVDDGGEPLRVDLTSRLGELAQNLGWHVVKVLCPGYQPLRLDETLAATWDLERLAAWSHRYGLDAQLRTDLPHPLI
ncbi:MAG: YcaO-like family protein [Microbacterium sp.]|nr:YcaO-like family protein [Microbacterium sp.]